MISKTTKQLLRFFSQNKDFYNILGVNKNASQAEIKNAYHKLAMQHHPDRSGNSQKVIFLHQFKQINEAYSVLSDPKKKQNYDTYGSQGVQHDFNFDPNQFFNSMFRNFEGMSGFSNNFGQRTVKPSTIRKQIRIDLEDAYKGTVLKLQNKIQVICNVCKGEGGTGIKTCSECLGEGVKHLRRNVGPGMYTEVSIPCNQCQQEGKVIQKKCNNCNGNKVVEKTIQINVEIKRGVQDGEVLLLKKQGNQYPKAGKGDLQLEIKIKPHSRFQRRGFDLFFKKQISLFQSLTGFSFQVIQLDGRKLKIKTSQNQMVQNLQKKTVQNQGMIDSYSNKKGNLIIQFHVVYPKKGFLTTEKKQLLAEIFEEKLQKHEQKQGMKMENFKQEHIGKNPRKSQQSSNQNEGIGCSNF